MINIRNILVPTDYSNCAAQALEHAIYLANYCRAKLHIIHADVRDQEEPQDPDGRLPKMKQIHEQLNSIAMEKLNSNLQAYVKGFREEVVTKEILGGGSEADLILQYARDHDVDLIVMGTHGRRGLGYMFLGNIAQEVVRFATCPVYTVRESEKPQSPDDKNLVLCPVDFSEYSKAAVSMAREAAHLYRAKLQLLHVVKNTLYSPYNIFEEKNNLRLPQEMAERYEKEMKQLFDASPGPGVRVEFKVATGHVVSEILEYISSNGVDLIVIATHGMTGLMHFVLGGVAEKVIRRALCPILTVKSFGKSLI
jgi:nucleotide-binding universal stress UspA family protein